MHYSNRGYLFPFIACLIVLASASASAEPRARVNSLESRLGSSPNTTVGTSRPASSIKLPDPVLWSPEGERPYWRRNFFKRLLSDQVFLVTKWWPAEGRRVGFSVPLATSLLVASSSAGGQDLEVRWQRSVEGWASGGGHDVAKGLSRLGDAETGLVLIGTGYLISRLAGSERWQRTTSLSAEALVNAAIYSSLLKDIAGRDRPGPDSSGEFFSKSTSFPSGHAMGAFAVLTVIAIEFRDRRWVPWLAYGTAGLIALSRVAVGSHYPSDVVAGAVFGHSLGRMVMYRNGSRFGKSAWTRLEPIVGPGNRGFGIAYRHSW